VVTQEPQKNTLDARSLRGGFGPPGPPTARSRPGRAHHTMRRKPPRHSLDDGPRARAAAIPASGQRTWDRGRRSPHPLPGTQKQARPVRGGGPGGGQSALTVRNCLRYLFCEYVHAADIVTGRYRLLEDMPASCRVAGRDGELRCQPGTGQPAGRDTKSFPFRARRWSRKVHADAARAVGVSTQAIRRP